MSNNKDLAEKNGKVILTDERHEIALEATWEIEKLAVVIASLVPLDDSQTFFAVRGLASRIKQLACISMMAISDRTEKTESLVCALRIEGT